MLATIFGSLVQRKEPKKIVLELIQEYKTMAATATATATAATTTTSPAMTMSVTNTLSNTINSKFVEIVEILLNEDSVNPTNSLNDTLLEIILEENLFPTLTKLSSSEDDLGNLNPCRRDYRRQLTLAIATLVGSMSTEFLFNQSIYNALHELISQESIVKVSECSMEFILLEYQLALKVLESQELLQLFFFHSNDSNERTDSQRKIFPIFDHLIQLVHLEGEAGEYARAAFEALFRQQNKDLESYLLSTDFAVILLASLAGIFAQLPDVLSGISSPSSKQQRNDVLFKQDMRRFEDSFVFFQNCLKSAAVKKELLTQFEGFLLAQVLLSSLVACNDLDGSSLTTLFYIQRMIDLTTDQDLLQVVASFLFSIPSNIVAAAAEEVAEEDSESSLCAREIILSKINSLSEPVATSILRIIFSFLSKGISPTLFFDSMSSKTEYLKTPSYSTVNTEYSDLISDYLALLPPGHLPSPSSKPDFPLENSIISLSITPSSSQDLASISDFTTLFTQDAFLHKLTSKLASFFSQSVNINLLLTDILCIVTRTHPAILVAMSKHLKKVFLALGEQVSAFKASVPNYEVRLLMARQKMVGDDGADEHVDVEGEMVFNIVVFEEFVKEFVGILVLELGV